MAATIELVRLIALEGVAGQTEFVVPAGGTLLFGRSQDCQVVLDDDDVSREHCRLIASADGCRVEDLASMNGTYLNGVRLTAPTLLVEADLLVLGRALFEVHLQSSEPPRAAAPVAVVKRDSRELAVEMRLAAEAGRALERSITQAVALLNGRASTGPVWPDVDATSAAEAQRLAASCRRAQALTHPGQRTGLLAPEVPELRRLVASVLALCALQTNR